MVAYYQKLIEYKGLLKAWHELSEEERNTWIVHKIPDFSILDLNTLSQDEIDILSDTGKYTIREMTEKLNLSAEELSKLLVKMSNKHLILFSAFI
jgi:hypothetical protein